MVRSCYVCMCVHVDVIYIQYGYILSAIYVSFLFRRSIFSARVSAPWFSSNVEILFTKMSSLYSRLYCRPHAVLFGVAKVHSRVHTFTFIAGIVNIPLIHYLHFWISIKKMPPSPSQSTVHVVPARTVAGTRRPLPRRPSGATSDAQLSVPQTNVQSILAGNVLQQVLLTQQLVNLTDSSSYPPPPPPPPLPQSTNMSSHAQYVTRNHTQRNQQHRSKGTQQQPGGAQACNKSQ